MSSFNCKFCKSVFEEKNMLETHEVLHCRECFKWFSKLNHLKEHEKSHASSSNQVWSSKNIKCVKRAFKDRIISYLYENQKEEILHPQEFFNGALVDLLNILNGGLKKHVALKYNLELECEYMQIKNDDIYIRSMTHRSKMQFLSLSDDVEGSLKNQCGDICTKMSEFQERDSGWSLLRIKVLEINVNKSSFIKGSKYIPTPHWIAKKQGVFNYNNDDEYCFKWSVIASLLDTKQNLLKNISIIEETFQIEDHLVNFESLEFPLKLKDIAKFEKKNPNISINVFGCEGNQIVGPYYLTSGVKSHHINLLLLTDEEWSHYVLITDISRLIRSSLTSHKGRVYLCNACLQYSSSEKIMNDHEKGCKKIVSKMPKPDECLLYFKNHHKQIDVPFVIFADFEAYLEKVEENEHGNIQRHIACAFSYYIKCSFDNNLDKFNMYFGEDAPYIFIENLISDTKEIYTKYLSKNQDITLSNDDINEYNLATNCHICEKILGSDKVKDHCHMTGKYRGAAHNSCSLLYRIPNFIPVFFHNFSSYDCHLFVTELSKFEGDVKVIPLNKELYISLSKFVLMEDNNSFEIRFLDSFRFMASSLESLANNLNDNDFKILNKVFQQKNEFNLIRRKGIFPYSYIDSMKRFNETNLPNKEHFYNILNNTICTNEDYEHAQSVWKTFKCNNLLDYTKLYLKTDVLLLTDIFLNFRHICKSIYKLDPCQYYTAPGLSWDAMLKTTKIELELLRDVNMYNFIQDGIRGGLVQCSKRYSKANNKYLEDFDSSKPSEYLMYLDANNLYGWAMSEYLPYGEFEWNYDENILNNLDVTNISDTSEIGYFLEVDLEYPNHLHEMHNDLPFCPENKSVGESKYKKLIADLTSKTKYKIHYRVLKQCIKNGLKLKKIHRALKFKQSPWLKKYINLNTYHRTLAKNSFEKDFFKLLNNAVYGKTMENVLNRTDVKIVSEWETTNRNHLGARALISKPNFSSITQFSNNMFAIQLKLMQVILNKPIYLGFAVLELSKWKMYDFHYQYMKPKFQFNLALNYMDTDSFIYTIKTEDFYADIHDDIASRFDTSEYHPKNIFNLPLVNKKVLGMMKDENSGKIMKEFVGLRSKMYSFKTVGMDEIKKSKGVKKSCIKTLSIMDYKQSLFEKKILSDTMNTFRSKRHQLYTQKVHKVVLSYADDKRIIASDQINTYARGHFRFKSNFDHFIDTFLNDSSDDEYLMNVDL